MPAHQILRSVHILLSSIFLLYPSCTSAAAAISAQPSGIFSHGSPSKLSGPPSNLQAPNTMHRKEALLRDSLDKSGLKPEMRNDLVGGRSTPQQQSAEPSGTPGFRKVPKTGVIFVSERAEKYGWYAGNPEWSNLGQGMPETGEIKDAPPRIDTVIFDDKLREYGPVPGIMELRKAVASFYNEVYRKGKESKYTAENVCIVGGGRLALARLAASLGNVNIGHVIPDYTAYEELLTVFRTFTPIPLLLDREQGFKINAKELRKEINGRGLSALLFSNPNNPTGALTEGPDLAACVDVARDMGCSLIIDEIYSHYIWTVDSGVGDQTWKMVSAAQYVHDVNKDPVVILDGLTKNWRLPGWRCCWILGPADVIQSVSATGSFMDGGASGAICRAALPLLNPEYVIQDCKALQKEFLFKRRYIMEECADLGIEVDSPPTGSFYLWCNVKNLPPPLNDGMGFLEEALKEKVIIVPGIFFDVNPGRRRPKLASNYSTYIRLSFGPSREEIFRGMAALRRIISKFTSLAATAASPSASRASPERAPTLRPADAAAPIEPSRK